MSATRATFEEGELVVVQAGHKKMLRRLRAGKNFSFNHGAFSYDDVIGRPPGIMLKTSLGRTVTITRPTLEDFIMNMKRKSGIIYPKDLGMILVWSDIYPGARVLTAGAGSGALTIALLRSVGREGAVYAYDVREDMLEVTEHNVREFFGEMPPNLHLKYGNIEEQIDEESLDRIVLDVPEPWRALKPVARSLQPGGFFTCYLPTITQSKHLTVDLERMGAFRYAETFEVIVRPWHIDPPSVRPSHQAFRHTGFLTVARRVERAEDQNHEPGQT